MGVERVDYSSEEEYQQALAAEMREAEMDMDDDIPDLSMPTCPCAICGEETDMWEPIPEDNLCPHCDGLTRPEQIIVLNRRINDENKKKTIP